MAEREAPEKDATRQADRAALMDALGAMPADCWDDHDYIADLVLSEGFARIVVYGQCTACGSVEVALVKATETRDMSWCGESPTYPAGYGCEVCA